MTASLRERKKARTHRTIRDIADRLFLDQGYSETTLEQICGEAEVSVQTLLRYFESKEALALARYREDLAEFRERISSPGRSESAMDLWRAHVTSRSPWTTDEQWEKFAEYFRFIESVHVLLAGKLAILREYEDLLTQGLCADAGTTPGDDSYSRLLAACLVWGNMALIRHSILSAEGDPRRAAESVIDTILRYFPLRKALEPARSRR